MPRALEIYQALEIYHDASPILVVPESCALGQKEARSLSNV
jgi:hypothetical protein